MHFIVFGLLLLFLTACGDQAQTEAIEAQLAELRARPQGQLEALPNFPVTLQAKYQQQERDPFVPTEISTRSPGLIAPDPNRQRQTLESWDLNQLSFRGSMQRGKDIRALIITPDNQLVSVTLGDRMGKDHGTITHLDKNSLTLRELISTGSEWQEQQQTIYISK